MYMINSNKMVKNLPEIILIALLLIPAAKQISYYEIIVSVLFLICFAISLYRDVINRQYSTSIFIIIIDVINIIVLIVLCYLYFMNYDKTNVDFIWNRKISIQRCALFLILMIPIKYLLENQRFKK